VPVAAPFPATFFTLADFESLGFAGSRSTNPVAEELSALAQPPAAAANGASARTIQQ
jgi:hypothetical protein